MWSDCCRCCCFPQARLDTLLGCLHPDLDPDLQPQASTSDVISHTDRSAAQSDARAAPELQGSCTSGQVSALVGSGGAALSASEAEGGRESGRACMSVGSDDGSELLDICSEGRRASESIGSDDGSELLGSCSEGSTSVVDEGEKARQEAQARREHAHARLCLHLQSLLVDITTTTTTANTTNTAATNTTNVNTSTTGTGTVTTKPTPTTPTTATTTGTGTGTGIDTGPIRAATITGTAEASQTLPGKVTATDAQGQRQLRPEAHFAAAYLHAALLLSWRSVRQLPGSCVDDLAAPSAWLLPTPAFAAAVQALGAEALTLEVLSLGVLGGGGRAGGHGSKVLSLGVLGGWGRAGGYSSEALSLGVLGGVGRAAGQSSEALGVPGGGGRAGGCGSAAPQAQGQGRMQGHGREHVQRQEEAGVGPQGHQRPACLGGDLPGSCLSAEPGAALQLLAELLGAAPSLAVGMLAALCPPAGALAGTPAGALTGAPAGARAGNTAGAQAGGTAGAHAGTLASSRAGASAGAAAGAPTGEQAGAMAAGVGAAAWAGGEVSTDAATTDGPLLLLLTAALRRACSEGSSAVAPAAASSAAACGHGNSMAAAGRGVEGVRQLRCLLAVCLVAHHCLRRLHATTAGPAAAAAAAAAATIAVPCGLLRLVRGGSGDAAQPPACSTGASCGTPPGPRGGDDALGDVPEGGGGCTGEAAVPAAALLGDALYCLENLLCSWQDDVLRAVATGSTSGTGTDTEARPSCDVGPPSGARIICCSLALHLSTLLHLHTRSRSRALYQAYIKNQSDTCRIEH